jgi:hypothetical protein
VDAKVAGVGGLALGAAVFAWQLVSAATMPGSPVFVPVAVGIQFGVTALILRARADRQGYRAQVATGIAATAIAAVWIALTSLLVSAVLFPGLSEQLGTTPVQGAIAGAVGTFSTGLIVSAGLSLPMHQQLPEG